MMIADQVDVADVARRLARLQRHVGVQVRSPERLAAEHRDARIEDALVRLRRLEQAVRNRERR